MKRRIEVGESERGREIIANKMDGPKGMIRN